MGIPSISGIVPIPVNLPFSEVNISPSYLISKGISLFAILPTKVNSLPSNFLTLKFLLISLRLSYSKSKIYLSNSNPLKYLDICPYIGGVTLSMLLTAIAVIDFILGSFSYSSKNLLLYQNPTSSFL